MDSEIFRTLPPTKLFFRCAIPSMITMAFGALYQIADGLFVGRFIGGDALAAINLIMPYLMVFGTLGFMIGTGGTALISMTLGMGDKKKANELFSLLTYVSILGGIVLTVISVAGLRPAAMALCDWQLEVSGGKIDSHRVDLREAEE